MNVWRSLGVCGGKLHASGESVLFQCEHDRVRRPNRHKHRYSVWVRRTALLHFVFHRDDMAYPAWLDQTDRQDAPTLFYRWLHHRLRADCCRRIRRRANSPVTSALGFLQHSAPFKNYFEIQFQRYVIFCENLSCEKTNRFGVSADAYPVHNPIHSIPFIGTAVFAFEGIALIIPIRESMAEQEKFPAVMRGMLVFMFVLLSGFGLVCYLAWGNTVPSVALNAPDWSWEMMCIQLGYVVAGACGFPIITFPCFDVVESYLFHNMPQSEKRKWLKNLTRTTLTVSMAFCAIIAGADVELFISFVGSMCCIPLATLFPALIHRKVNPGPENLSDAILFLSGIILLPVCVWTDIQSANEQGLLSNLF